MKPFIYFDMGKVLIDFDFTKAQRRISDLTGLDGGTILDEMFSDEYDFCCQFETGDITSDEFFGFIIKRYGLNVRIEELEEAYNEIFTPYPEMERLAADLSSQGYRLGILSNTCMPHWNYCQKNYPSLFTHFEILAASCELHAMKPSETIYLRAAELTGVSPQEIIFIDDRPENIDGARAVGFDGHVFRSVWQLINFLSSRDIVVRCKS